MNAHLDARPSRSELMVIGSALALQVAVLAVDTVTPLGVAVWVLHLVPIAISLWQRDARLPYALLALAVVFTIIGLLVSPGGGDVLGWRPMLNRFMGLATAIALAYSISQVLRDRERSRRQLWLQQTLGQLAGRLAGEPSAEEIARHTASVLCERLQASIAAVYGRDGDDLRLLGGEALGADMPQRVPGHGGLLGQVLRDGQPRALSPAPDGHLPLVSALGRSVPAHVLLIPLQAEGRPVGVVELGLLRRQLDLSPFHDLAEKVGEDVGIALRSAWYRGERQALLEESQRQAEELQAQQEELRVANEELEEQSRELRQSQSDLELQQSELERVNAQLSLHAQTLEEQRRDLWKSQAALEANAEALALANRTKSEFLANMSHELRTPLNSSLILSRLLMENRDGTLRDEQVRYARAIHDANNDLLVLINDILDLSKLEAGRVELQAEPIVLPDLLERLRAQFEPVAHEKGLAFVIERDPAAPQRLITDGQRLQQVLKNLLSNAIKFTSRGQVVVVTSPSTETATAGGVRLEVRDTGLGIAADKHELIFEAFRQADGSTSRQFGGTGLGLSISRQLVRRMGGLIGVESSPGRGSTFWIELPAQLPEEAAPAPAAATPARPPAPGLPAPAAPSVTPSAAPSPTAAPTTGPTTASAAAEPGGEAHGGQTGGASGRRVVLAVEDDSGFAATLATLVEELGFACVSTGRGDEALRLARELQPAGVLLDVGLPDISGLSVLEQLKRSPHTRHIPVHLITAQERSAAAFEMGAIGHVVKPARREELVEAIQRLKDRLDAEVRRVLVVEDDEALRRNLALLLQAPGVEIDTVGTMAGALEALQARSYDCMVTDLTLPDGSGFDLLERMAAGDGAAFPPVIVYTGRALSRYEEARLRRYSRSIIVKGARSPERLLDEVTLFLHSVESALPSEQQRLLQAARRRDAVLEGRRILLAEDDVRNVFALTSVFEPLGVVLEIARNGREAVTRLGRGPDIDLVLMDVMMPEMDGLTAIRHIRARPGGADLPIVALTAKAMPDDRQQCLAAGANDYLAKPIDVDRLVSLCRVWMPK